MKLLRYGPAGGERPGILDVDGRIRDLYGVIGDIDGATLSPSGLDRLRDLDLGSLPLVAGSPRFGVPLRGIGKILAIGLNYADHAAETGAQLPSEPLVFTKQITCLNGPNDPVVLPEGSTHSDWEVELAIVIGSIARYVPEEDAAAHIAGFTVMNDVSERDYQKNRGGQWTKGKSCDTFGPLGPLLVTADEVPDPQNLGLWLDVNGERRQTGSTSSMVFGVSRVVSHLSQFMTLMPGDVITTGTPPGVGAARTPPQFLQPGDVITLGIDGICEQRQEVRAWPG